MTRHSMQPVPSDETQIESWSNLEFHRAFLADEVRNNAYQTALRQYVNSDSMVLDIGSGTGLLSFFAAQAGAKKLSGLIGAQVWSRRPIGSQKETSYLTAFSL